MQTRIAAIMACGFLSFGVISAAGAASDHYYTQAALSDTQLVSCHADPMEREDAADGLPGCSVHRVSNTYARQSMAMSLRRDRAYDD